MKKFFFVFALCAISLLLYTCKKGDSVNPSSGAISVESNVTLVVDITHHWWGVPSIPVYIKLNATTWPGRDTTLYDLIGVTNHQGLVQFNHFGPGKFEIYSAGYDSIWGGYVLGYNNFSITKADANNTVYDNVVVSEKF
jgi:hypothetical protein